MKGIWSTNGRPNDTCRRKLRHISTSLLILMILSVLSFRRNTSQYRLDAELRHGGIGDAAYPILGTAPSRPLPYDGLWLFQVAKWYCCSFKSCGTTIYYRNTLMGNFLAIIETFYVYLSPPPCHVRDLLVAIQQCSFGHQTSVQTCYIWHLC